MKLVQFPLLLLLVAALFTFSACNNDDADPQIDEDQLTITAGWNVESIESDIAEKADDITASFSDTEIQQLGITRDFLTQLLRVVGAELESIEPCQQDDVYRFETGGTIAYSNAGTDCDATDPDDDSLFEDAATWSLTGNQLTITDSDGPSVFTVRTLTSDRLVIEAVERFDDPDSGISSDVEVSFVFTFSAAR